MAITPRIILASSSIYRRKQLAQLMVSFEHASPDIDESAKPNETAKELALRLSKEKALKIQKQYKKGDIIIGADQSAQIGNKIIGKPSNPVNATKQLLECSHQEVTFYSGICVARNEKILTHLVSTQAKFRNLSLEEITNYISKDNPIHCAGSFKCESLGISLFEHIQSNDPSALTGLPLITLNRLLIEQGFNPLLIPPYL